MWDQMGVGESTVQYNPGEKKILKETYSGNA